MQGAADEALFDQLCRLYWLKPADVPFDFEVLSYVRARLPARGAVLDIGCGDGIVSSLVVGGRLPPGYDRYAGVTGTYQKIGPGQADDIFANALVGTPLSGQARRIDIGVDPKAYHVEAARLTGTYDRLLLATCEGMTLTPASVDFAMAIFALYWVDDLRGAVANIVAALKPGATFVTVMPTELNRDMHGANALLDAYRAGPHAMPVRWFTEMQGNRRDFINRHAGTVDHWTSFFGELGLRVVDATACLHFRRFFLQDTFQRGLFPYVRACSAAAKTAEARASFVETFTKPVARAILDDTGRVEEDEPAAYYLLTLVRA
jgi:SAM-dependent methyltransferase